MSLLLLWLIPSIAPRLQYIIRVNCQGKCAGWILSKCLWSWMVSHELHPISKNSCYKLSGDAQKVWLQSTVIAASECFIVTILKLYWNYICIGPSGFNDSVHCVHGLLDVSHKKVKVSSYIAQYPILRIVQSALHITSLADLFNQTPSQLLGEASSHMLQLMREGCSYTYPPLVYNQVLIYTAEWPGAM